MTVLLPTLLASHGGFGLNLNPFETNIINLAIVIFGLWKFLPGFLGSILERRRNAILSDLQDAEQRLVSATSALAQAQQDLAAAQQKADQIRADGQARAEALRQESEKRTIEEMARLKQGAIADLSAEAARVTDQLRREAANRAIAKALSTLPGKLDASAQARLIDQSITTLGKA
ncbi:F0F1 ATP synthase subunit B [Cyanobium sp. T1B-Tous]|jgi:F-type H+-transporting ATPase subunit b|uniref:F0F1 ATP synthase subunit B n=1 Tax=Cyanobium sp. T1B-Tous TaxID=2823721 RepID=UPI0020CFA29F|nr:F0F1 ATP synthase subunit B [Cyanobium sp. T1B-Tous]MCP9805561.1 F0F1 ATP synthase subunit B [Cyanobium sp. T1B-Tous]MCX5941143.1 F0F1 ATP synthase subunit B [Cyanobium sp. LacPavin_0818_WC50_MAG_67_9]